MIALDMSAVFDMIDHNVPLQQLQHTFGITGFAFDWIKSYCHDHRSYINWGSGQSVTSILDIAILLGSFLGPRLFTLYVAALAKIITSFGAQHHQYADNTYLYIFASKEELTMGVQTIEHCADALYSWLSHNGLAVNPLRSKFCVTQA